MAALALSSSVWAGEIFEHTDPATGTQVYVLKQGGTVVRFAPTKGANVFSIQVRGIEYLRTPPNMYAFNDGLYGVPILYPTPNRVSDAKFVFHGQTYELEPNFGPHRIHGLVISRPWRVLATETTERSASISSAIEFAPGTRLYQQFPFAHRLVLSLDVTDGGVRWTYEVDNSRGATGVPFGFGLHPYFRYQGAREDTFVTLPATHLMEARDALPSGELIPAAELDYRLGEPVSLHGRTYDDVFWGMRPDAPAVIDFRDRNRRVTLAASAEFTHAVLWAGDSPIFSVENQTSSTDAHNLHAAGHTEAAHLQVCAAGETCSGWVEYRFSASGNVDWIWEDPTFLLTRDRCESCHGIAFTGARAPDLMSSPWRHAESEADLVRIIRQGLPHTDMPAFERALSEAQIRELAAFMNFILKEMPAEDLRTAQDVTGAGPRQSFLEAFALETVVEGLDTPWSFAFLPDGRIILNEKPGRVRLFGDDVLSDPVRGTPEVAYRQDAGLLALVPHPEFAENGWIYLAFADPGPAPDTSALRIVRGRIRDQAWVDQETIWSAPQALYTAENSHFGTRLLFIDGDLFFSIGDSGVRENAQDLASPYGKIHRIRADGSVPADNPFVDLEGALQSIWSYGHRNPQGLALAADGSVWSSEHGPRGGDELNRIEAGRNYGWPLATHGLELNGDAISEHTSVPGMADPQLVWRETIAPANIGFYSGERFPAWQDSLLVGSLAARELRRVQFDNGRPIAQELLVQGIGRIRDVQIGPDGYPYLAVERSSGAGCILRLIPATIPADAPTDLSWD
jgi:glucose/arabinose dehydrogenase/galactose mutarotase-like enzyme